MQIALTVIHLFLAIGLIGLILIQHGRGADAGAAFGSGASGTVFGARGSGSFLSRTTAILAALFFITSVVMAYYAQNAKAPEGLMDGATGAIQLDVPGAGVPVTIPAPIAAQDSGDVPTPPAAVQMQVPVAPAPPVPMSSGDVPPLPAPTPPEAGAKP